MKKDFVRKQYLKKRQALSLSKFKEDSSRLVQNTIELIKKYKPEYLHCFIPIHRKGEINTLPIIQFCWENNIKVVVPVSNFEKGTMKNAVFSSDTRTNQAKYNITEPINPIWIKNDKIDLVITPLLAFDPRGYRVGYGKGFYDRFFESLQSGVEKIGVSFFEPCEVIDDINEFDIPLTCCVTPKKNYFF